MSDYEQACRQARSQLAQGEARFRPPTDNANDVVSLADITGCIEYISPSVEAMLGFPPEDFIGKAMRSFVMAEDYSAMDAVYRGYAAGGDRNDTVPIRYRILHRDGHEVWLEAHPRIRLDKDGQPVGFQDVVRDITVQKAMEDALARAGETAPEVWETLGDDTRMGHVLVADDHAANLDVVAVLLRSQGYSVETARNGAEALRACLETRYDLVVMDIAMPVMDGLLATRGIRAGSELNARTPVIGISAASEERRFDALAAGMSDLVAKPIMPATLLLAVSSWMSDRDSGEMPRAIPAARL